MDEESKEMEEALAKSGVEEQKRLERQKHKEQVALSEHYKKTVSISDPSPSKLFMPTTATTTKSIVQEQIGFPIQTRFFARQQKEMRYRAYRILSPSYSVTVLPIPESKCPILYCIL